MDGMFEAAFLACFAFGALFTLASAGLSGLSGLSGGDHGFDVHHPHGFETDSGDVSSGEHGGHTHTGRLDGLLHHVNLYSINGFLTWFGAVGFGLTHFAGWPLAAASGMATAAGIGGGLVVAVFLARLRSGERIMNPADYRLEGTLARVSVGIEPRAVGEIVFEKHGGRRSEAARSLTDQPLPRGTEVLIVSYANGVANVRPFAEIMSERFPEGASGGSASPSSQS